METRMHAGVAIKQHKTHAYLATWILGKTKAKESGKDHHCEYVVHGQEHDDETMQCHGIVRFKNGQVREKSENNAQGPICTFRLLHSKMTARAHAPWRQHQHRGVNHR